MIYFLSTRLFLMSYDISLYVSIISAVSATKAIILL